MVDPLIWHCDLVRRAPVGEEANSGNLFGVANYLSSNLMRWLYLQTPQVHRTGHLFCSLRTSIPKPYLQWETTDSLASPALCAARLFLMNWFHSANSYLRLHLRCIGARIFIAGEAFIGKLEKRRDGPYLMFYVLIVHSSLFAQCMHCFHSECPLHWWRWHTVTVRLEVS